MNDYSKLTRIEDLQLAWRAMDIWGAKVESDWIRETGRSSHESGFLLNGFHLIRIPDEVVSRLQRFFDKSIVCSFDDKETHADYFASVLPVDVVSRINAENVYYRPPSSDARSALEQFLTSVAGEVESQLAHRWRVINVRAWETQPEANIGPNAWHVDGFSHYLRKIMLYLRPPNEDNGTIEIFDRTGDAVLVDSPWPVGVLFDSATLLHRGRPSRTGQRPVIEITIMPAEATSTAFRYAGQNARSVRMMPSVIVDQLVVERYKDQGSKTLKQYIKSRIPNVFRKLYQRVSSTVSPGLYGAQNPDSDRMIKNTLGRLNLGGGPTFNHPGWMNLEAVPSSSNPFPFSFSSTCQFPLPSSTVQLVYSSHCLEHLDDQTVERVIGEARRVVSPQGYLLLKLPDFDLVKKAWREKDTGFFAQWGIEGITPTWPSRDVEDNFDNRAAMIFCGFWNKAYGDHFAYKRNLGDGAYHGPAVMPPGRIAEMLSTLSPHAIANELSNTVRAEETNPTFNHQNAWSQSELEEILTRSGFSVKTIDADEICHLYADVPGILVHREISIYCLAIPRV